MKAWYEEQTERAQAGIGFATTQLGRRRLLDIQRSGRSPAGWEANRSQMLNHPIQGSCADGYKLSAALVHEERASFRGNPLLVNMVHDELVLEVDTGATSHDTELLRALMLEGMQAAVGSGAPIRVDVTAGRTWAEKS